MLQQCFGLLVRPWMEESHLRERVDHSGLSLDYLKVAYFGPCPLGKTLLRGEGGQHGPWDHRDQREAYRMAFLGFGHSCLSFGGRGQRCHEANENCRQDTLPVHLYGHPHAQEGDGRGERVE